MVHSLGLQSTAPFRKFSSCRLDALLSGVAEVGTVFEVSQVVKGLFRVVVVVGVLGFVFVQTGNESRVEFKIFVFILILHEAVVPLESFNIVYRDSQPLGLPQVVNEFVELHLEVHIEVIVEAVLLATGHEQNLRLQVLLKWTQTLLLKSEGPFQMRRNLLRIKVVVTLLAAPQDQFLVGDDKFRGIAYHIALELALVGFLVTQKLPQITWIRVLELGRLRGGHRGTHLLAKLVLLGCEAPHQHAS